MWLIYFLFTTDKCQLLINLSIVNNFFRNILFLQIKKFVLLTNGRKHFIKG